MDGVIAPPKLLWNENEGPTAGVFGSHDAGFRSPLVRDQSCYIVRYLTSSGGPPQHCRKMARYINCNDRREHSMTLAYRTPSTWITAVDFYGNRCEEARYWRIRTAAIPERSFVCDDRDLRMSPQATAQSQQRASPTLSPARCPDLAVRPKRGLNKVVATSGRRIHGHVNSVRVSFFFTVMGGPSAAKDNKTHPDVSPMRSTSPVVSFVLSQRDVRIHQRRTRVPRQKTITRAEVATRITHKVASQCTLR